MIYRTFCPFVLIKLLYYCDFNCCALILKNVKIASCFVKRRDLKESKKVCYQYGPV